MKPEDVLAKLGLNNGEIRVYLALLKLGSVTVAKLKEETNLHRTTIYDFLEKLLNKGLANYVIKNNVKFYKASDPKKLFDLVKEKEELVKDILPTLVKISNIPKGEVLVEVYKGKEGLKTILNDVLRVGKDYVIFGVDESMYQKGFESFMEQFFRQEEKLGFHERILTGEDAAFVYKKPTAHYRYMPREFFNPTPTYVWGDNVAILIWEPLTVIKIKHKGIAQAYAHYFELLWGTAKFRSTAMACLYSASASSYLFCSL